MITSVGYDAKTSCASIRAGIVRPSEILHFSVLDEDTHKTEPLVGYPIKNVTDGFGSVGRWLEMSKYAAQDLIKSVKLPDMNDTQFWNETALVFVTPNLSAARFEFEDLINAENAVDMLVKPFLAELPLPVSRDKCFVVSEDNIGVISSFKLMEELNTKEHIERFILIVVDSSIDAYALSWISSVGQLKTTKKPTGLIPGEAAAALLFETTNGYQNSGSKPLLGINSYNTKIEDNNLFSDIPSSGEALKLCIEETLHSLNLGQPYTGIVYTDLNGEEWRAREYSGARVGVSKNFLSQNVKEQIPALSLGDVGVVNAACSLCMIVEAKKRAYLRNNNALVVASSATGHVGSLAVTVY